MKEHYLQLFKYDGWAAKKLLDVVLENQVQDQTIRQRFSHILFARQLWLWRLLGKTEIPAQLKYSSIDELVTASETDQTEWLNFLNRLSDEDFFQIISYRTTEGTPFENQIKDILTHVVNHSTYHRGQITAILKPLYEAVPSTDFIFFLRE